MQTSDLCLEEIPIELSKTDVDSSLVDISQIATSDHCLWLFNDCLNEIDIYIVKIQ